MTLHITTIKHNDSTGIPSFIRNNKKKFNHRACTGSKNHKIHTVCPRCHFRPESGFKQSKTYTQILQFWHHLVNCHQNNCYKPTLAELLIFLEKIHLCIENNANYKNLDEFEKWSIGN